MRTVLLLAVVFLPLLSRGQDPLEIEPVKTSITVTEKVTSPTSGYITSFSEDSLESRPGVNVDDRLRDIPGFTLFRRTSSIAAHPTTQGVSLRGIGSSAASRSLVLYDGIPVNDPFGGWVYWSRFNPDAIDDVEISRGVSTSVYGDRAMGGVISLFTPAPASRHVWTSVEGGDVGIADARGGYSELFGKTGVSAMVRGFRSDGYFAVAEEDRGSVDRKTDVDFLAGDFRWDYFRDRDRFTFRTNLLAEQRGNGTPLRFNSSSLGTIGGHYQRDGLSMTAYHTRGALRSTFSFVNDARDFERQTLRQKVTFEDTGGSVVWNRTLRRWNLVMGADSHRASGVSRDTVVATGFQRRPGGRLWQQGLFVQSDVAVGSATHLYAGLRHDFTDRGNDFWSPRAGIAVSEGPRRWRASAYRSFRAPTLNEFFRRFQVGNIVTLSNPGLAPETLTGVETGMDWRSPLFLLRLTLFRQSIDDLIANATIQLGPPPVRQRQNVSSATGHGAEIEIHKTFRRFRVETAYLYVDSQLDSNFWMPQVPRHQGSFQLLYSSGKTLFSGGVRSYAAQFEDDLNQFLLPGFASVQLLVKRRLSHGFSGLVAVENLLNRTFLVGFTPTATVGAPRLLRVGLKWEAGS